MKPIFNLNDLKLLIGLFLSDINGRAHSFAKLISETSSSINNLLMRPPIAFAILMISIFTASATAHPGVSRGLHPLDWHTPQINSVMTGGFNGGEAGYTSEIGGKHCMTGNGFTIDVLDDYAYDIDEKVEVEVEFDLKTSHSQLELWYDESAPINAVDNGLMGHTIRVELPAYSEKRRWYKETFILKKVDRHL